MRVGSLFSGIGGIDLGLERAGMSVVWQCESDPYCRAVLKKHWPDVPCFGDVQGITEHQLRLWPSRLPVDLICGGFPCQPVSQAGQKRAQADDRWLWPEFARVVGLLRPRYVLVENVSGLLARGMGDVLGDLAELGFDAEWESIPAAAVGAPHIRDRVFIVGYRPAEAARWAGSERGLLAHAPIGGQRTDQDDSHRSEEQNFKPDAERSRSDVADPDSGRVGLVRRPEQDGDQGREQGRRGEGPFGNDADGLRDDVPDATRQLRNGAGVAGPGGWRQPSDPSWWAVEPAVGRVADGVPSRVDRLRALGNAVVPQVAEWIGRRLMVTQDTTPEVTNRQRSQEEGK